MTYNYISFMAFCHWCNDRATDGFWGAQSALTCIRIMDDVNKKWFSWRREKYWRKNWEKGVREQIVNPTERAMAQYYKAMSYAKTTSNSL